MWRVPLGIASTLGGLLFFLPMLGLWMLPPGFLVLALDVQLLQRPVSYASSDPAGGCVFGRDVEAEADLALSRKSCSVVDAFGSGPAKEIGLLVLQHEVAHPAAQLGGETGETRVRAQLHRVARPRERHLDILQHPARAAAQK